MIKSCVHVVTTILFLILFTGNRNVYARAEKDSAKIICHKTHYKYLSKNSIVGFEDKKSFSIQNNKDEGRTFIINTAINDLDEFRKLVKQAVGLKLYGTVQINIGTLADKSFYEIPKGGNPWNEYASNNAPLYKFFPDAKIARFVPSEFVKKNRQLLLDKAK